MGESARHHAGADNGIGMASALAVLADDSVAHGPLEVLPTMTEEPVWTARSVCRPTGCRRRS
ncbi:aminoacyl-histidine dipeptidase [Klebsiella variicola]|uniref:Aminoacyl-histidine dipeptidase n=1 Tax=Klebsiella variicola TaxID=244366 RepID=A0A7H4MDY1_KLEVA|nr:aminoacyl-histidine dipeptidase [Klebsiella variicola]